MTINKLNKKSPWFIGALAAAAGSSQAATVQITLINNQVSHGLGSTLNADLTGDANDDIGVSGTATVRSTSTSTTGGGTSTRTYYIANASIVASDHSGSPASQNVFATYGFSTGSYGLNTGSTWTYSTTPMASNLLVAIQFSDASINGGAVTNGWLDVRAENLAFDNHSISLTRLIFDDASTTAPLGIIAGGAAESEFVPVPEPSSLALLALGAGGLIARRKRKAA